MIDALRELIERPRHLKEESGLLHTPSEILGQAELWMGTFDAVRENLAGIKAFLGEFLDHGKTQIVCTGAGSSEFVGSCVEGLLRKKLCVPVSVASTTTIVTNPEDLFPPGYRTLLLSFARSGNSPESIGAVEIADQASEGVYHFVVTCNEGGALKKWADARGAGAPRRVPQRGPRAHALLLDGRTDDAGLAMTASFTNMVVAGQLLAHAFDFDGCEGLVRRMIEAGTNLLTRSPDGIRDIARADFDRAVFLGNGAARGAAIESHLKLQELTAGKVMCAHDTFLGLRHGPEAVIDDRTLVVAYLSEDPYRRRYEEDLIAELEAKKLGMAVLTCAAKADGRADGTAGAGLERFADHALEYDPEGRLRIGDDYAPPVSVIVGQLLGLFKSVAMGLKPDDPSEGGVINRVVKGVKVYDWAEHGRSGRHRVIAER